MTPRPLTALAPLEFENLVFDLLRASGLGNLRWRTPGTDGGRDLEAERSYLDFAGETTIQRWYIEAKHYETSVDWPTVRAKLSFAENAQANFLLMVTSSAYSPKCIDEVAQWNRRPTLTKVRLWPRHEIDMKLRQCPYVAAKYGLLSPNQTKAHQLDPGALAKHLAKATISAIESPPDSAYQRKYSELSAALAELLLVRFEDLNRYGRFTHRAPLSRERWYDWLKIDVKIAHRFDAPGLRALACCLRVLFRLDTLVFIQHSESSLSTSMSSPYGPNTGDELIDAISIWSDLEVERLNSEELLVVRTQGII
jgi:hypothetical protein